MLYTQLKYNLIKSLIADSFSPKVFNFSRVNIDPTSDLDSKQSTKNFLKLFDLYNILKIY